MSTTPDSPYAVNHPPTRDLLRWFDHEHLPAGPVRSTSAAVSDLAWLVADTLPPSAEMSAGLRKLLEAKDCFVRAAIADSRRPDA